MSMMTIKINDWIKLPSGRVVEVRRIVGDHHPDAEVRYLNEDGAMAAGCFTVKLAFLAAHGERV